MKFLVEMHLKPGMKNVAADTFELRGPNRNPHVQIEKAWIGAQTEIAFALVESADEAHVAEAAMAWSQYGDCKIHPVVDIEQY